VNVPPTTPRPDGASPTRRARDRGVRRLRRGRIQRHGAARADDLADCLQRLKQEAKPPPPKPKPASTTGSFSLVGQLSKDDIKNPNAPELTIDAAGEQAPTFDNRKFTTGAKWTVDYSWKLPKTLTPGKNAEISLELKVSNVQPEQPLFIQMTVRAPDFPQPLSVNYTNPAEASKTFTIPISTSYRDAKDLTITIGVESAEITYHYRK
jgi:hypothetical protein